MNTTPAPVRVIEHNGYCLTNHKNICRRGVLWLGQTCNLRCKFCYFATKVKDREHPEHAFASLEKAKQMCKTLVDVYGNNAVDIQGGEPTIYKDILPLLRYCNEIGLKPTLITNAQVLERREKCQEFKDAGVYDLLISMHGTGKDYDDVVQVPGAYKRILTALDHCSALGIPFRFNCVLCQSSLPHLQEVADTAVKKGARAVNFIAYNPFVDQADGKRVGTEIPVYSQVAKALMPVIDYLEAHSIETNLRYLPFCLFPEKYRKNIQNLQQIIHDLHEWEAAGEIWTGGPCQRVASSELARPVNFYDCVYTTRMERFHAEAAQKESDHYTAPLLEKLEAAAAKAGRKWRVAIFGNLPISEHLGHLIGKHPHLDLVAYVTSSQHRKAETCYGRPWQPTEWLASRPVDVVINTSLRSQDTINALIRAQGFDAIEPLFVSQPQTTFKPLFYLPELGEVQNFSEKEYAYKEYRVLMARTMHPYSKGEKCQNCSLTGICDGFHRDYAQVFGFDEANPEHWSAVIHDPRYYTQHQMKVVEPQEYNWALPKGSTPAPVSSAYALGN